MALGSNVSLVSNTRPGTQWERLQRFYTGDCRLSANPSVVRVTDKLRNLTTDSPIADTDARVSIYLLLGGSAQPHAG